MFTKHEPKAPHQLFAETQMGIVTRYGDWFHITSEQIETFVPGLLDRVELHTLVKSAQAWVKSADSLSMLLLLALFFWVHPLIAAGLTLVFHLAWYLSKSSIVTPSLNPLFNLLYKDGTQLLFSLIIISYMGLTGNYLAVAVGLIFFFILKLALLRKVWDRMYNAFSEKVLTLNDRVMKMVIIRYAIIEDLAPDEIKQMENRIKELASNRKKK